VRFLPPHSFSRNRIFHIFLVRSDFQMIRSNTRTIITRVHHLLSLWNWSNEKFVRQAMCQNLSSNANIVCLTVPIVHDCPGPFPAMISFFNMLHKKLCWRSSTVQSVAFVRTKARSQSGRPSIKQYVAYWTFRNLSTSWFGQLLLTLWFQPVRTFIRHFAAFLFKVQCLANRWSHQRLRLATILTNPSIQST